MASVQIYRKTDTGKRRLGLPYAESSPAPASSWNLFGPEAGGYVTGLSTGLNGAVYARTDVGGAYRWSETARTWRQLMTVQSLPGNAGLPGATDVDAIACAPSNPLVVYCAVGSDFTAAEGHVLRSSDGGDSWTIPGTKKFIISGNAEHRYSRIPLAVDHSDTNQLLFGTRKEGLWRSLDGAVTWTQLTALPAPIEVRNDGGTFVEDNNKVGTPVVMFDPASPLSSGVRQGIWAGVRGRGVYRSTNGGSSWTLVYSWPDDCWPADMQRDSNGDVLVALYKNSAAGKVIKINGSTNNVTEITPPGNARFNTVAVHPSNADLIFAADHGVRDGYLYRSVDAGMSWTSLNVAINNGSHGAVWPTQSDLEGWMSTGQIRFDTADPSRLWFAEGMGIWRSSDLSDAEVTWSFECQGVQELVANAIIKPAGTGAVAATWDRGCWKWNSNDKATLPYNSVFCSAWDVQARPDAPLTMAMVVSDHQSGDGNADKRLSAITEDGGTSWTRLAGLANGTTEAGLRFGTIAIARGNTNRLVWAPCYEDWGPDISGVPLRYSSDRGATWQTPTIPGFSVGSERISNYKFFKQRKLIASPWQDGVFYAVSYMGGDSYFLQSTDWGVNWTRTKFLQDGGYWMVHNAYITAVPAHPGLLLATTGPKGTGYIVSEQVTSWKSTDYGITWSPITSIKGAHAVGVGAPISPSSNQTLFTSGWVGDQKGIYYSTDLGESWIFSTESPLGWDQMASAIAGDPEVPGKVYVGLTGGSFFTGQVV